MTEPQSDPAVPPPPSASAPASRRGGTFLSIQALRGVAAVLVAIFHAGLRFDPTENTFRIGNSGVDIFFVISGFVMWTVTTRRPPGPVTFLRHRFVRLAPLYWLCTLAMAAGAALVPAAFPRMHPSLSHTLLSMAFVPHVSPDQSLIMPVLGQGWTLNFEVFFYLLFAIALLLPLRWRLGAIAAALVALPVAGLFLMTQAVPVSTLLSPLLIEFLGGIVLAWLVSAGLPSNPVWPWACVALGVVLLLLGHPAADDDQARLVEYGIPAFLIVTGAVGAEVNGHLRIPALARWIGDASYSIYLTHTFAISALDKVWPAALPDWLFLVVAVLAAVALGGAVYVLLERPLLARLRDRPRNPAAARLASL